MTQENMVPASEYDRVCENAAELRTLLMNERGKVEKLREALEFYVNLENYMEPDDGIGAFEENYVPESHLIFEHPSGAKAREALASVTDRPLEPNPNPTTESETK